MGRLLIATIICLGAIFSSGEVFAEQSKDLLLAPKTLTRWADPVVAEGRLMKELAGAPISNLRLYAFRDRAFEPIRFQIDEMTEDGDWVFPEGPMPNGGLGNGKFDPQDKLLFMAADTGDRVAEEGWMPGWTKGVEIEVLDPLTGGKGWCYLLSFSSEPPRSSLPDYIRYDYASETIETDYYRGEYIITEDGLHTTYYKWHSVFEQAGGNGKNFVDRLKIRLTVKLLFSLIPLRFNEEKLKSDVLAYKTGAIRVNRRVEQYIRLPFGKKAMRAVVDVQQYRNTATVPVIFQAPFRMNKILSSFIIRFGTDYGEEVLGTRAYNSSNPQGFLVDGKMDKDEKNFNPAVDKWRLITGDFGTFMTRTVFTPEILESMKVTMGLIDDVSTPDPPESHPGNIGYIWQDWDVGQLRRGTHYFFLEFYFLPHYKPGDEIQYVNYLDHPLKIRVGEEEGVNQSLLIAKLGKRYR